MSLLDSLGFNPIQPIQHKSRKQHIQPERDEDNDSDDDDDEKDEEEGSTILRGDVVEHVVDTVLDMTFRSMVGEYFFEFHQLKQRFFDFQPHYSHHLFTFLYFCIFHHTLGRSFTAVVCARFQNQFVVPG